MIFILSLTYMIRTSKQDWEQSVTILIQYSFLHNKHIAGRIYGCLFKIPRYTFKHRGIKLLNNTHQDFFTKLLFKYSMHLATPYELNYYSNSYKISFISVILLKNGSSTVKLRKSLSLISTL